LSDVIEAVFIVIRLKYVKSVLGSGFAAAENGIAQCDIALHQLYHP
jgi:hypothetical protein